MGFPSPAQDYIERRLDLNDLLIARPAATLKIDTCSGFVLVDRSLTPCAGDTVALELFGNGQTGRLYESCIVTEGGEVLEEDVLESVMLIGVVTFEIVELYTRKIR
ncbi:phage repressor protein [Mixta calida]|uniref:phage repressor protein n=1 Tax=Mixta calida TaxID=665913 RepID=UPI0034D7B9F5